jgi:hypothetical protein
MYRILIVCGGICFCGCSVKGPKSRYEAAARQRLASMSAGHTNVQFVHSLKGLPPAVREMLGQVAEPGGPFSEGCIGEAPHLRLLAAMREGAAWNVAVEQGGFVYTWFIARFLIDDVGKVVRSERIERGGAADGS